MLNHNKSANQAAWLLAFFFGFGIIFHVIPKLFVVTQYITDLFLFAANISVLIFIIRNNRTVSFWLWLSGAFLFTYLIEFLGVITGKIFGIYWYGETLILQLGNVPLIIPLNWLILILCTYSLAIKITSNRFLIPLISSIFIVLFDILIEPVAIKLNYWQWEGSIIPVRNYVVWFLISFFLASVLGILKIDTNIRLLRYYFLIQVIFFIFIRVLPIPVIP